ncbi:glutathione S-transferase family protein [Veronia pacifica]|uniref:Glutathione S-transferase n=1 Tax=Veronia pacifica TaxID=1080227 RepID=A0A1C3EKT0_9GAMM|nr:glutathione S-transferase family protein [Veronia pacifica]ODA33848.1 glutathione S-transferase [Veronia pacifica]
MYTLYYFPRNASFAPHLLLQSIGVPYELTLVDRKVDQQKSADYLKVNPTGRIPALKDNDIVIYESAAICLYLAEKHPEAALIPSSDSPDRGQFYQWLCYLTATFQPELMIYFYPERHLANKEDKSELTKSIKDGQQRRLSDILTFLDTQLEGKTYLCGNKISACDYFLFMLLHWASGLDTPPIAYPNLKRFISLLANDPAVIAVCEKEGTPISHYQE